MTPDKDKSPLETALEHAAIVPPDYEPEIAADDSGATALAEAHSDEAKSDEAGASPEKPEPANQNEAGGRP